MRSGAQNEGQNPEMRGGGTTRREVTLKEAKENNYKFKSNCECKKLLGERWEPVFRGGNLDIK